MSDAIEKKRIVGFKLSEAVIDAIQREAITKRMWPAHVIEEMARKRYRLPRLGAKRKASISS